MYVHHALFIQWNTIWYIWYIFRLDNPFLYPYYWIHWPGLRYVYFLYVPLNEIKGESRIELSMFQSVRSNWWKALTQTSFWICRVHSKFISCICVTKIHYIFLMGREERKNYVTLKKIVTIKEQISILLATFLGEGGYCSGG